MDGDFKETLTIIAVCMVIFLTITVPVVIGVCIYQNKQLEIEKYRIEMKVKYGDMTEGENNVK